MFCPKCGTNVEDGKAFCPACGAPMGAQQAAPQAAYNAPAAAKSPLGTIGLICGIVSIVLGVLGGPMYGFICALIALLLGVGAIVLAIMAKNAGAKASGALVTGIIGAALGFVFFIGCMACGCADPTGYTKYGCCGASCKASSDVKRGLNSLSSYDFDDLFDF